MRVLVTGATGFIGSALVRHLSSRGLAVVTTSRSATRDAQARHLDLSVPHTWESVATGCDAIVHCAAATHERRGDPHHVTRCNVDATLSLANQARLAGEHFIFLSSASAVPANPALYATSKLLAEGRVRALQDLRYTILRPALVIGPPTTGRGLFSRLCALARTAPCIPVPRTTARFSTVHIDDLCDIVLQALHSPLYHTLTTDVGAHERLSIGQIIRGAAEALYRRRPAVVSLNQSIFGCAIRGASLLVPSICFDSYVGMLHATPGDPSTLARIGVRLSDYEASLTRIRGQGA